MTRQEITSLLDRRQAHWDARDAAALAADHAPDGVVHSPIFGTVRGAAEIEASYQQLFKVFADWEFEPQDLLVDGHRAVQVFRVTATHTSELFGVEATHRRFEIRGALIFEFRDSHISDERRLYDFTAMLLQLGVLKARPR